MKEESKIAIVRAARWAIKRHLDHGTLSQYQICNLKKIIQLYSTRAIKSTVHMFNVSSKKSTQTRGTHPPRLEYMSDNSDAKTTVLKVVGLTKQITIKVEPVVSSQEK